MSIDHLFMRQYHRQTYNCAHFLSEAWEHITGEDISERLRGFLLPPGRREAGVGLRHKFERLNSPDSPCIVVMSRSRSAPHVGLFYNRRVLHITERGVFYQPLKVTTAGFTGVRFYR